MPENSVLDEVYPDDHQKSQKVIWGSLNIFSGTVIGSVFGGIRAFIIAGILGPSLYGLWNILLVILSYNAYAHVGLLDGMVKQMPYLRGKGDHHNAEAIKDNTTTAVLIITTALNVLFVVSALLFHNHFLTHISISVIITLAITNILFQMYTILISLLRTDKKFGLFSCTVILLSVASLCFVLLFITVMNDKLWGVMCAMLGAHLIVCLFVFITANYKFRVTIDLGLVKSIFKIGFPIIIIQIGYVMFTTIDRWMIIGMIDQESVGYYGIGLTLAFFLATCSSTVAFTLYPFMLERYGQTNNIKQSEDLVYTPIIIVSYIMSMVCTVVALVSPLLITYILPAYVPGIDAAIILVLGVYFISIMTISGNFLVSVDKQNTMLYLQMAVIPLSILLNYAFIKGGWGIEGVAVGTAITYLVYGTGITMLALKCFSNNYKIILSRIVKIYFPFIACLFVYLGLRSFFVDTHPSLQKDLIVGCIQIVAFLAFSVVLVMHLNRSTGIVRILRNIVYTKINARTA